MSLLIKADTFRFILYLLRFFKMILHSTPSNPPGNILGDLPTTESLSNQVDDAKDPRDKVMNFLQ